MFNRKGQSTLEYALIVAVVVAGLLLMQHYVKRGYAGRLKTASDDMGEQFDPVKYSGNFTINQSSRVSQTVTNRASTTNHLANQISNRTGNETLNAFNVDANVYN
ncbi:MAG: hypothetical protein NTW64_01960 [Candidatus Omnitrophica bacterium]|nr:hypothetical protein [Candidatus Omnitrophota bacterium]